MQRARDAGFTLIELMVVVLIIALLIGGATYAIGTVTRSTLRSAATRTAATVRLAFDRAMMTGSVIRVAIDIEKRQMSLERSEAGFVLGAGQEQHVTTSDKEASASADKTALARKPALPFNLFGSGGESEDEDGFGIDSEALVEAYKQDLKPVRRAKTLFKPLKGPETKRIKLPGSIAFKAVMSSHLDKPVSKGIAYLYFFPQGHTLPAVLHLADKTERIYSIVVQPLTGLARVYSCKYRIPEEFGNDLERAIDHDPCEA